MGRRKKEEYMTSNSIDRDSFLSMVADTLNKRFKATNNKIAYFLDEENPAEVSDWVSTGNTILDIIISNQKYGGIPVGRITEILGLEASGKSLLCSHIVKSTQQKGGVAVYIDTESALNATFLTAIGVDIRKMIWVQPDTIEECFETIESLIEIVRSESKDKLVTIILDSASAAPTKKELESSYDKVGYNTDKAIIISQALRKITNLISKEKITLVITNQYRLKLDATMFGEKYSTSGGKALPYHASLRIKLQKTGNITIKSGNTQQVIGVETQAKIIKNRLAPAERIAKFDIYFHKGIDDYGSWLKQLKLLKLANTSGPVYIMKNHKGEEISFYSKNWDEMLETDPEFKDYVHNLLYEHLCFKYQNAETDLNDKNNITIISDEEGAGDDSNTETELNSDFEN